jgi:hypothetical protein
MCAYEKIYEKPLRISASGMSSTLDICGKTARRIASDRFAPVKIHGDPGRSQEFVYELPGRLGVSEEFGIYRRRNHDSPFSLRLPEPLSHL